MTELRIGPISRSWLETVDIWTLEDLQALGAVEAWKRAKAVFPEQVSLNLLYTLQAILLGCRWNDLPPGMQEDLRRRAGA